MFRLSLATSKQFWVIRATLNRRPNPSIERTANNSWPPSIGRRSYLDVRPHFSYGQDPP